MLPDSDALCTWNLKEFEKNTNFFSQGTNDSLDINLIVIADYNFVKLHEFNCVPYQVQDCNLPIDLL